MSNLVISNDPIGTPEELQEAGISPLAAGSCSKHTAENIGCSYWSSCAFAQQANGGFRGQGPRNIGYYLKIQEGNKKEDWMACFQYMHALHPREQAQDRTGEVIAIVAQEGDLVTRAFMTPEEPIINNKNGNMRMKNVVETIKVPVFPRLKESQPEIEYERRLIANRKERIAAARRKEAGLADDDEAPKGERVLEKVKPERIPRAVQG